MTWVAFTAGIGVGSLLCPLVIVGTVAVWVWWDLRSSKR